ncbi:hypothetical protein [Chondromyces apiculatus]|uniref:hypothetical protein n=1 Tax=Chondromyces apiculatus TaxID=51 RepID=UPI0012DF04C4|nr:hypothetical protein [Chondromyces apiculatus]
MKTVEKIIQGLASGDVERQVAAVEQASVVVGELAAAAVNAFEHGPNHFLIAERLHMLGTTTVPYLQDLLRRPTNEETKTLAALVLLQLNDRMGVPILLAEVEEGSDYAGLCANHLAQANIDGTEAAIVRRLAAARLDEVDLIVSLVIALRKMGRELPSDLSCRFNGDTVPWQIRTLL